MTVKIYGFLFLLKVMEKKIIFLELQYYPYKLFSRRLQIIVMCLVKRIIIDEYSDILVKTTSYFTNYQFICNSTNTNMCVLTTLYSIKYSPKIIAKTML